MPAFPANPRSFIPLSNLSFHVILALGGGVAHGYAIGKEIERRSEGRLKPTTGALYQALKRLSDDGLIAPASESGGRSTDSRRRYFELTPLGREVASLEAARLHRLVIEAGEKKLYPEPPR